MTQLVSHSQCPDAEVVPGEAVDCTLHIHNPSDEAVTYTVTGLPHTHVVTVRVARVTDAAVAVNVAGDATPARDDVTATVAVAVENRSNHPLTLRFHATDAERGPALHARPPQATIPEWSACALDVGLSLAPCPARETHAHHLTIDATRAGADEPALTWSGTTSPLHTGSRREERERGRWLNVLSMASVLLVLAGLGLLAAAMVPGAGLLGAVGFVSLFFGTCLGFLTALARIRYGLWR